MASVRQTGRLGEPAQPAAAVEVQVGSGEPDWGGFLRDHPQASLAHSPLWGQVMHRAYGNRPWYLTARSAGRVTGVLTLVHQTSRLFGRRLCSVPYLDAAGPLATEPAALDALLAAAERLRSDLRADCAELRSLENLGPDLPLRTDKVTLRLALPDDPDVLWTGLKAKVRNLVRKPQKAGLTLEQAGPERLGEFCRVYVRNMRDLGSPPHSRRFFEHLTEAFGQAVRLYLVRGEGRVLAASLTLSDAHGLHVPWAASDWRQRASGANMLLYWGMLEDACRRGAGAFDFGRSTRDSGTYAFKTQWGAQEVPLYWHYLLPPGQPMPDLRPDSPKYRLMAGVWKKLPLPAVRVLGPRLIRKLS